MKKLISCLLATIGLSTACGQNHVTTDTYEVDVFKTKSGKVVKFHALMHSSIRIEYDGKEIEIDPCAKLRERTVDYTMMPKADYLFVTHEHFDHYDSTTIALLTKEQTQLVMNQRCADMYGAGKVMVNGDQLLLDKDFSVEAVPAYNTTEGHRQYHPKGRDNGYTLTLDGLRIYIAGDGGHPRDGQYQGHRYCLPTLQPALHDDARTACPFRQDHQAKSAVPLSLRPNRRQQHSSATARRRDRRENQTL